MEFLAGTQPRFHPHHLVLPWSLAGVVLRAAGSGGELWPGDSGLLMAGCHRIRIDLRVAHRMPGLASPSLVGGLFPAESVHRTPGVREDRREALLHACKQPRSKCASRAGIGWAARVMFCGPGVQRSSACGFAAG